MTLTVEIRAESSFDEILFFVDAKLGRLTKSDLLSERSKASPKAVVSRREFLFRLSGASQPSDAPVVLAEACEARFGCTKCVDECPAPGALKIDNSSVIVSDEHCIRCGLCASVCPVAAIQMPRFSEDAYRGLLDAMYSSQAPKKTLVITCNQKGLEPQPWTDVEEVPGVGGIGIRQLVLAAASSLDVLIVHCADGLCPGRENARRAVDVASSLAGENGPAIAYLEGESGQLQIAAIQKSAKKRHGSLSSNGSAWKNYVESLKLISRPQTEAADLGLTNMDVAESCTLCYACVESCPHRALEIQEDKLQFQPEECTGCGYCEKICPEHSITLSAMNGTLTLLPRIVYRDEMIKCTRCHSPYVSAKMFKRISETLQGRVEMISLCPSCRQKEIYENIFGKSGT